MTLLDRLRAKPRWQHADAAVRLEAVREIPSQEQDLLGELARGDADPRVRRAALRRLADPSRLAEAVAGELDLEVREEAAEALQGWALAEDEAVAQVALAALGDPRRLAQVAQAARVPAVRSAALARIDDPRLLGGLAKRAEDPAIRAEALGRLAEPALILEVAARTDHKDVAIAAVDRIDDLDALEGLAARARHKAASRRARGRLETLRPPSPREPEASSPAESEEPDLQPALEQPAPAREEGKGPVEETRASTQLAEESESSTVPNHAPPMDVAGAGAELPTPDPLVEPAAAPEADVQRAAHDAGERERRELLREAQAICERLEALKAKPGLGLSEAEASLRKARQLSHAGAALPGKLLHQLKLARAAVFARAQELREADEWARWGNATVQEQLCARMEALGAREDFERVAREFHDADIRWARFRHAPKDQAEALRQRYQAARALVKARLDAYFARRVEEEGRRLEQKRALVERAEALADSTDWLKAGEELKALQAGWKQIGPVSRRRSEALWKRFRAACDRFFERRHADLQRRKAEWAENLARKLELCVRAEELAASSDWDATAAAIKTLQAQWKGIGPVRRSKSEAVWQRFRSACDVFFERYKNRDAVELAARRAVREALCAELEAAGVADDSPRADLLEHVRAVQARWRQAASLPADDERALERRFREARSRLVAAHPEAFRGSDLDPELVRERKQKLLARVESLSGAATQESLTGEALARRLKEALADNTIGGAGQAEARRRAELEEVEAARRAWARLGSLGSETDEALEQRFAEACVRFFESRRPAESGSEGRASSRGRPSRTGRASRTP